MDYVTNFYLESSKSTKSRNSTLSDSHDFVSNEPKANQNSSPCPSLIDVSSQFIPTTSSKIDFDDDETDDGRASPIILPILRKKRRKIVV